MVQDLYENQKKVFKYFSLHIDAYYKESLSHAKFMDYALKNFESDIYIFFDLDCIPLNSNLYENIVNEILKDECIIGIEQSANHLNPNFIYAGPACFAITKDIYNKLNQASFDGTHRSDIAQEYSYLCLENKIKIKFFEIVSNKNNKWKLGGNRFFGNGCIYKLNENLIYHQFQTHIIEEKEDFIKECKKIYEQKSKKMDIKNNSSIDLNELAIKYNTDKSSKNHNYVKTYDKYFKDIKNEFKNVLEIGVLNGSSLKMWEEYFPNATIYGIDMNPNCKQYETERCKIIVSKQDDEELIKTHIKDKKLVFDTIIDDGSHISNHQISSFNLLFDNLKNGGLYIIEDVCCSYWESHEGGYKKSGTVIEHFKEKIDDINYFGFKGDLYDRRREYITSIKNNLTFFEKNVNSIHFYNSIIIIEKI